MFVLWACDPQVIRVNFLFFLAVATLVASIAPDRTTAVFGSVSNAVSILYNDWSVGGIVFSYASMIITGGAALWLVNRALQTLWRPVPELIDILGVDVPTAPDVSLTAIGADKATITWSKPTSKSAVDKYVIQVNGVNVGESATSNDTFITVSGLKPNHFYNVRIIAVGSNSFQAGSRVLRLRTFDSDGRPRLSSGRPSSDSPDDDSTSASRAPDNANGNDDSGSAKQVVTSVSVQTSTSDGTQAQPRDGLSGVSSSSRRNTISRRHSPSTTSLEYYQQASSSQGAEEDASVDEEQMAEHNNKYWNLRKETEETSALCAKDEEETKKTLEELEVEKRKKRQELKKKEEQTKKLTKEQHSTERAMRAAQSLRSQKEKKLKEKTAELDRLRENVEKWEKGIADMKCQQESYQAKSNEEGEKHQTEANELRENNKKQLAECTRLEAELKKVRQAVKELEDGRKELPTTGDDNARLRIVALKRNLQRMEAEHRVEYNHELLRRDYLDNHIQILSTQIHMSNINAQSLVSNNGGFDHAHAALATGGVPSPTGVYTPADMNGLPQSMAPAYPPAPMQNSLRPPPQHNYLTGPFMGVSINPHDPEDAARALTAGAPLSPSAKSLIPSSLFDDNIDYINGGAVDSSSSSGSVDMYSINEQVNINTNINTNTTSDIPLPNLNETGTAAVDTGLHGGASDPQSPASSNQSRSLLSSPRESSQNLVFSSYNADSIDGRPPTASAHASPIGGPATVSEEPANSARFGIFSFQRSRGTRPIDEEGPALGTLKHGQSQSFPRQGDDIDGSKHRRSGWGMFTRNSTVHDAHDDMYTANGQTNGKAGLSARSFLPFTTRANIFDRNASSPRPSSMASIDMPRPSTDSGSIWGPPGENGVPSGALAKASHLWTGESSWPSRNPSRRQSQHGSPSALRTNLASADDKILDEEELLNPETSPSQVGVIGSKPPTGLKAVNKSLNPAAPTFMANIFRPKGDKGDKGEKDKEVKEGKSKGKEKAKDKSKGRDKDKGKAKDSERVEAPAPEGLSPGDETSPSAPRMSRDGHSVHTQVSVSDSRESLDYIASNTTSEPNSVGMLSSSKDSDSALFKLFRKDSSVKRSLQRMGRAKGSGSIASLERNASMDHRSSFGDYEDLGDESLLSTSGGRRNLGLPLTSAPSGSVDSVTSSPSVGTSKSRDSKGDSIKIKGAGWFSIKKKNRDKESLDIDRNSLSSPGHANGFGLGEPESTVSSLASLGSIASTDDGDKKA